MKLYNILALNFAEAERDFLSWNSHFHQTFFRVNYKITALSD